MRCSHRRGDSAPCKTQCPNGVREVFGARAAPETISTSLGRTLSGQPRAASLLHRPLPKYVSVLATTRYSNNGRSEDAGPNWFAEREDLLPVQRITAIVRKLVRNRFVRSAC